jgi:tetratricopeptide (TPR) repeat protein
MTAGFDLDVQDLIARAIDDPASTLTRTPEDFSGWLRRREALSGGEALLTRAEKHLVRAHREELAILLYQACQSALFEEPTFNSYFCRKQSPSKEVKVPEPGDWKRRAARELPLAARVSVDASQALKEALARFPSPGWASRLAVASFNLLPRDETRIWLGLALHQEGSTNLARLSFEEALRVRPSTPNEALAHLNLGSCAFRSGDLTTAWEHYAFAARVGEGLVPALAFLMSSSILLGRDQEAIEASKRLEESVSGHHALLDECARVIRAYTPGVGSKESSYCKTISSLWDRLSAAGREVLGGAIL